MMNPCPSCQSDLENIDNPNAQIDVCLECGGVFLDAGELGEVARGKTVELDDNFQDIQYGDDEFDHEEKEYHCPSCDGEMQEREYAYDSGIHIDVCTDCSGVFLESGELGHISAYLHSLDESVEAKEKRAFGEALIQENKAYQKWESKLESEIDDLYTFDDLPIINTVTEFLVRRFF